MPGTDRSEDAKIEALDLATRERKVLIQGGNSPRYAASGHLLYETAGTLRAVAFDPQTVQITGNPVPVVESIVASPFGASFSVSRNGTLVYVEGVYQGGASALRTLVWVDRQGGEEPISAPPRPYAYARLSPDGTRVALDVRDQMSDIWIWHLERQTLTRLTFDPASDVGGVWSPEGNRVAFSRGSEGGDIYWQAADGTGSPERLTTRLDAQNPTAFSPDSRLLLFNARRIPPRDIGMVSLEGERRTQVLLQTTFDELNAEVSPDGRWVAYQSNESGRFEVYVRPFPDVDSGRWQVSTGGGTRPLWTRNGSELFYYVADGVEAGTLMSVPIRNAPTFVPGSPGVIFRGDYLSPQAGRMYDASPDGKRFLMIKAVSGAAARPPQLVVVQNWFPELERLAPAN